MNHKQLSESSDRDQAEQINVSRREIVEIIASAALSELTLDVNRPYFTYHDAERAARKAAELALNSDCGLMASEEA